MRRECSSDSALVFEENMVSLILKPPINIKIVHTFQADLASHELQMRQKISLLCLMEVNH